LIIAYKDKDAQSLTTDVAVKCSKVRGSTAGHAAARSLVSLWSAGWAKAGRSKQQSYID